MALFGRSVVSKKDTESFLWSQSKRWYEDSFAALFNIVDGGGCRLYSGGGGRRAPNTPQLQKAGGSMRWDILG